MGVLLTPLIVLMGPDFNTGVKGIGPRKALSYSSSPR
jgi:5'-3' exonuclease